MNRSLRRLYMLLSGGFVVLILLLGYWQVVAAEDLNDRRDNPQRVQRERLIDRGRIISADGKVLALSVPRRVSGRRVFVRRYPLGTLAPQVVGYTSLDRGTGLEDEYNRYLAGSYGSEPLLQRLNLREKRGADVRITLDTRIQRAAVDALAGRRGAAVALDPRTGAVLAMASTPGFDLNDVAMHFDRIKSAGGAPLLNRASAGRYPPGSTFKVVTATSALQSGLYNPSSTFDDTGRFVVNGLSIFNFGRAVFGAHTLTTALTKSINTTFARVGARLGARRLGATMAAYGFGQRPPIDLPEGEVAISGRYRDGRPLPADDPRMDAARVAIGQEQLLVTPLQMAMVSATIANGGVMMAPHLLRRVVTHGGSLVREERPREFRRVTTPQVASSLNAMMQRVVEEGTGTAAALSGLAVAGKTGTAETGQAGRNQAWFIGFAPAQSPRVAVAVVMEDTSSTGGVIAAPVAAQVMRAALDS